MLKKNDKAPDFEAKTHEGQKIKLSELDASLVVLYFYPKDMTPGCTIQAKGVNDNLNYFKENNIQIFGISRDSLKSHLKFVSTCNLNFPLIEDEEKNICALYEVLVEKSMFGKKYMGVSRTTFIINPKTMTIIDLIEKVNPITHISDLKEIITHINL